MHDQQSSDGELLRRFRDTQEADAFAQIVERFTPLVLGIAMRSVRNRHSAEDVYQATFLVLARDASKIRTPDSLAAWLYGTAVRISKRAASETRTNLLLDDVEIMSPQLSPFEVIQERHRQEIFDEELQRLPEHYRAVLVLHIVEGKTYEQTAEALGTSIGAVRGYLQRGKREFKLQLIRRGIQASVGLTAVGLGQPVLEASAATSLATSTVQGSLAHMSGASATPWCSLPATQLAALESAMFSSFSKLFTTCALLAATITIGLFTGSADARPREPEALSTFVVLKTDAVDDQESVGQTVEAEVSKTLIFVAFQAPAKRDQEATRQTNKPTRPTTLVKYGDGEPDGKKSIAGTGEIIEFSLPDETQELRGLKLHCARYGYPQAPKENVRITIVNENGETVHSEAVPYATFKRGESKWTNVLFKEAAKVPKTFSAIVEFNAARTKGVYLSYDTSTGGKYSKTGVPGGVAKDVSFKGDWMVQAILSRPQLAD